MPRLLSRQFLPIQKRDGLLFKLLSWTLFFNCYSLIWNVEIHKFNVIFPHVHTLYFEYIHALLFSVISSHLSSVSSLKVQSLFLGHHFILSFLTWEKNTLLLFLCLPSFCNLPTPFFFLKTAWFTLLLMDTPGWSSTTKDNLTIKKVLKLFFICWLYFSWLL